MNNTPPTNTPPTNTAKNNTSKNNASKNNSNKNSKKKSMIAGHYARNVPILIITAVFLFFVLFQYLKAQKYKEDILKQKIDAEIKKKLYYADDYY